MIPHFAIWKEVINEGPIIITKGDGVYLWDVNNNKYIDGMSILWVVNVGHNRNELLFLIFYYFWGYWGYKLGVKFRIMLNFIFYFILFCILYVRLVYSLDEVKKFLDSNFADDGILILNLEGKYISSAVSIDRNGKILISGYGKDNIFMARYDTKGNIDKSFGNNGIVKTTIKNLKNIRGIKIQEDGKILVLANSNNDILVIRYNSNGSIDKGFGKDGFTIFNNNKEGIDYEDYGYNFKIQDDGKILVVGSTGVKRNRLGSISTDPKYNIYPYYDILVLRFNKDGTLDKSFNNKGFVILNIRGNESAFEAATSLDITQNKEIFVIGYAVLGKFEDVRTYFIAKIDNKGDLDKTKVFYLSDSFIEYPEYKSYSYKSKRLKEFASTLASNTHVDRLDVYFKANFYPMDIEILKDKKILLTVHSKLKIQEEYHLTETVEKRKYVGRRRWEVTYEKQKTIKYNYISKEDIVLVKLYNYKGEFFRDDKFANGGLLKISELASNFQFDNNSINIVENVDDKKFYFTGYLVYPSSYYTFIAYYFYDEVKGLVCKNFGSNSFLGCNPFFIKMKDKIGEKNPYRGYRNIPTSIAIQKDGKILILGYCYFNEGKVYVYKGYDYFDGGKSDSFNVLNFDKSFIFLLRINP